LEYELLHLVLWIFYQFTFKADGCPHSFYAALELEDSVVNF